MITDIVAVPGLSSTGYTLLVGVQGQNGRFAWADCVVDDVPAGIQTVQNVIRPALLGQPLHQFRPLAEQVAALMETVTYTQTILPPENAPTKLSRRALFSGVLTPEPKTQTVVEKRPISSPIQFAVTYALLTAVAHTTPIAQVLAHEYHLEYRPSPVPLGYTLASLENPHIPNHLVSYSSAVSYTMTNETPLGKTGEQFQRQVQQLKEYLIPRFTQPPAIFLQLNGRFSQLFQNNIGKILGALYGLEQVTKPCRLYIANPIRLENPTEQFQLMRQLKEYVQLRKMALHLVVTPADHTDETGHNLHLPVVQLGNLSRTIEWAAWAHAKKAGILLEGPPSLVAQLAQVLHPALVLCHDLPATYNAFTQIKNEQPV